MANITSTPITGGARVSLAPTGSLGYSSYSLELRWDPSLATIAASSVLLVGSSGDYGLFNQSALSEGVLRAVGFTSNGENFSGSPTIRFDYLRSASSPITFALTQEVYDSVSASSTVQVVTFDASGLVTSTSIDTTAPTVAEFNPAVNSTSVGVEDNLVLRFSEGVRVGSGLVSLIQTATNAVVETFDLASSEAISVQNREVTINPSQSLLPGVSYTLTIPSGAYLDIAGNAYAGTSSYTFRTSSVASDTTPPILVGPVAGSTLPSLNSPITLTFSEAVQLGQGVIEVRSGSATGAILESYDVASSSRVSVSGGVLTISPSANWPVATSIYVVIPGQAVRDLSGNQYAGTSSLNLLAGVVQDTVAPALTNIVPANNGTISSLDANLQLTFSEPIYRGSGKIEIRLNGPTGTLVEKFDAAKSTALAISSSVLTINPSSSLLPGSVYCLVVPEGSLIDGAGNAYAGLSSEIFVTPASPSLFNDLTLPLAGSSGLSSLQLKAELTNLPAGADVSQLVMGNNLVLSAKLNNGTTLGKVVANKTLAISGVLPDTAASLALSAPAGTSVELLGPTLQVGPGDAQAFVNAQIELALPQRAISVNDRAYKAALQGVIADACDRLNAGSDVATKLISPKLASPLQALSIQGRTEDKDMFVLNMFGTPKQTSVLLSEVSNVVVAGPAIVSNETVDGSHMYGDVTKQTLIGGTGSDWLDGGGGGDTLFGGGGSDSFVLGTPGLTTIGDLTVQDVIRFRTLGISNFDQLVSNLLSSRDEPDGAVFAFVGGMEVKLVGYKTSSSYPLSMFDFIN